MSQFFTNSRDKSPDLLLNCGMLGVVAAGGYMVATGRLDGGAGFLAVSLFLALAILVGYGYSGLASRFEGMESPFPVLRDTGLLVLAWMLYRSLSPLIPQAALLPFLGLGYLFVRQPGRRLLLPLVAAFIMESGLFASGFQSLAAYLAQLAGLGLFVLLFMALLPSRPTLKLAPKKKPPPEPFTASCPELFNRGSGLPSEVTAETVATDKAIELIAEALKAILITTRQRLEASTVALLWPMSDGTYKAREIISERRDILPGPFPSGSGLLTALSQQDRITVLSPRQDGPHLPFHRNNEGIGSFFIQRIEQPFHDVDAAGKKMVHALLTVDRTEEVPFDEADNAILEQIVGQLQTIFQIEKTMRLIALDRDRVQTVCEGLLQLNAVLGLQSVFDATTRIVKSLVPYDLLAVSLLEEKGHRIAKLDGVISGVEEGQEFPVDDGLVGQVLKRNHWLPAGATYREAAPIFSNSIRHKEYKSLLVLPLRNEDNAAFGVLLVAGRKPQLITRQRRDLLELVAAQVAVKIDLARAHEKINQLATTDGLTGLANHRTFQHGFDMMLERTKRNQCPLCLILCDIDYFKKINDNHGHPFGDVVLKTVAAVLKKAVRRVDLAARYGGEEFALLLESADEKGGRMMAERIRTEIEKLVILEGRKQIKVTLSLGLSFFPKDAGTKEQLISYADQALYKAKSRGRNQTVVWSEIAGISGDS